MHAAAGGGGLLQALRDAGITLGDSQRQTRPLKDQEKRQGK
jgi:hypothetical protein